MSSADVAKLVDVCAVLYNSGDVMPRFLATIGNVPVRSIDNSVAKLPLTALWDLFVRSSEKEIVCLVNPDVQFGPNWLDNSVAYFFMDRRIGALTPMTGGSAAQTQKLEVKVPEPITDEWLTEMAKKCERGGRAFADVLGVYAHCYLIQRKAYLRVGGFDAETFPLYGQELDLNWRLHVAGYRVGLACNAFVYHRGPLSVAPAGREEREQARLRFELKHGRPIL